MGMNDVLRVSVDLTNTGTVRGEEVVQLYVHDQVASVTRPVKELKGFRRVALDPGQTSRVEFSLTADQLAFWNLQMKHVAEPGMFTVFVGGRSDSLLHADFSLSGN
jgi:beta-glucosidase